MKISLLIITTILVSCAQKNEVIENGNIITQKELYLSRETNYKNEREYFITEYEGLNTTQNDRIHTIGKINRGTLISFNRTERKTDSYIGNSTIYRGELVYRKKLYQYKATFYDTDGDEYIKVITAVPQDD